MQSINNKQQLIEAIRVRTGITEEEATNIADNVMVQMKESGACELILGIAPASNVAKPQPKERAGKDDRYAPEILVSAMNMAYQHLSPEELEAFAGYLNKITLGNKPTEKDIILRDLAQAIELTSSINAHDPATVITRMKLDSLLKSIQFRVEKELGGKSSD